MQNKRLTTWLAPFVLLLLEGWEIGESPARRCERSVDFLVSHTHTVVERI